MNYEEKYNEILEWARKNKARLNGVPIEEVLPELRESEDERIRRWLCDYFSSIDKAWIHKDITCIDILRWLEKQKDRKPEIRVKIPKFRVGDIIQRIPLEKWDSSKKIVSIDECGYNYDLSHLGDTISGGAIGFAFEDEYELVEQKPAESISQLTVQGKGVYKICPRCKERMVRDDSMVYTSMPPQYRYECPKCGESECDTVMYDNPEMEEKKPAEWSEEDEKQIRETLIQLVQDAWDGRLTAEVSDERVYDACMTYLEKRKEQKYIGLSKVDKLFLQDVADVLGDNEYKDAAKRLRDLSESLYLQPKAEWNEEDEKMLKWIEDILLIADGDLSDKLNGRVSPITDSAYSSMKLCIAKCLSWLKSLRPSWKPSKEQMEALNVLNLHGDLSYVGQQNQLISLYNDLKKLM